MVEQVQQDVNNIKEAAAKKARDAETKLNTQVSMIAVSINSLMLPKSYPRGNISLSLCVCVSFLSLPERLGGHVGPVGGRRHPDEAPADHGYHHVHLSLSQLFLVYDQRIETIETNKSNKSNEMKGMIISELRGVSQIRLS